MNIKRYSFREPNYRCRVSRKDKESGTRYWWLWYAEDEDQVRGILEEKGMNVHKVDPYDFQQEWVAAAKEEVEKAAAALKAKQKWDFAPLWGELKEYLFDLSDGKCVYCEAKIKGNYPGAVEHYRPKGKVSDEPDHPGYYWLAYDPDNYLPACKICNGTYKGNQFPLLEVGVRAYKPEDSLDDEQPVLLNPAVDPLWEHIKFHPSKKTEDPGHAWGQGKRAKKTIKLLGLNRTDLVTIRLLEQANARNAYKQACVDKYFNENSRALLQFLHQFALGHSQFLCSIMSEIEDYCQAVGDPSPFT
jgi:hypothetical protein